MVSSMPPKKRNLGRPLQDQEILDFLDDNDDESSFDESVGSDDVYVPQEQKRGHGSVVDSSDDTDCDLEWLEEEDPLLQMQEVEIREVPTRNEEINSEEEWLESEINNVTSANDRIEEEWLELETEVNVEINENRNRDILNVAGSSSTNIIWGPVNETFTPRKSVSSPRSCRTLDSFTGNSKPKDIFLKFFPKSLLGYIAQCTNLRIEKARIQIGDRDARARKRGYMEATDRGEIMIVLGCTLIMGYNQLPSFSDYWSSKPSLGNLVIKEAIGRDRCKFLLGKLYFTDPEQPPNASKLYYLEDVINCLKITFKKNREDSSLQSIDESMTKFKGRSTLKQYMPMKPVKRGIKMWIRADAKTGYTYDMNVYAGREPTRSTEQQLESLTLGENVVRTLISTIANPDTTICFDRFFTSVSLMNTLNFACVGTCNSSRKNMPKISPGTKFRQGEMEFVENGYGTIAVRWQDTKDVMLMSNCHGPQKTTVRRKLKTGNVVSVPAPEIVAFYRNAMGGVDRADRMAGEHEFERKSKKWWKKVFYRLLKMAIVNSWVIYREKGNPKCSIKDFLVDLSMALIESGKESTRKPRKPTNPAAKKTGGVIGDHLPVQAEVRKRCISCTKAKKDTRTQTKCKACERFLCKKCFTPWHLN